MGCAKVIDRAHQEHALMQRHGVAGQRPATARQRREAFPERRVQPLDMALYQHSCHEVQSGYTYCISRHNFFGGKQLRVL
jgi:hypothetical protein